MFKVLIGVFVMFSFFCGCEGEIDSFHEKQELIESLTLKKLPEKAPANEIGSFGVSDEELKIEGHKYSIVRGYEDDDHVYVIVGSEMLTEVVFTNVASNYLNLSYRDIMGIVTAQEEERFMAEARVYHTRQFRTENLGMVCQYITGTTNIWWNEDGTAYTGVMIHSGLVPVVSVNKKTGFAKIIVTMYNGTETTLVEVYILAVTLAVDVTKTDNYSITKDCPDSTAPSFCRRKYCWPNKKHFGIGRIREYP